MVDLTNSALVLRILLLAQLSSNYGLVLYNIWPYSTIVLPALYGNVPADDMNDMPFNALLSAHK